MDPSSQSPTGFSEIAALPPPPGVISNFIHPYSIAERVTVASIILVTLMVFCVVIRFYTKLFIKQMWGWDDCESLF